MTNLRLDDLYCMTAHIYGDRNSTRPKEATFAHFVEVCGMLTVHERGKRKEGFGLTDALCKALGWYFPLLAKMRVASVEDLVFRKYPLVCPYCREAPHNDLVCKQVRGTEATLNHNAVRAAARENWQRRPAGLDEWRNMFQRIYPRNLQDGSRSIIALLEELGELGEAVRVFDIHPEYFLGEAADTFSYLMAIATEHMLREVRDGNTFSLEQEYIARYPGLCRQCGSRVCICPAIPSATIGRMAKELRIGPDEQPFAQDPRDFSTKGATAAQTVLERFGGYAAVAQQLPFDRGDANNALVLLCLKLADAVEATNQGLASTLRSEAVRIGANLSPAGSPNAALDVKSLLDELRTGWRELTEEKQQAIKATGGLVEELGEILDTVRVLFIAPNPIASSEPLNLGDEQRAIRQAITTSASGAKILIHDLPAARVNDFRTTLLRQEFDVIHFSGHSDKDFLCFEGEGGSADPVSIDAFAQAITPYPVKCVVLNACSSIASLTQPISPITIGMDASIEDDAAVEFSRGFYDALASGRDFARAFNEGKSALRLAGHDDSLVRMISVP
ncbi:CHAT domain-containing protein [Rhizobiales bacterium GAS188]|nr:CHAT domain-containing protein [Rhizobiales bacterium GAS188]